MNDLETLSKRFGEVAQENHASAYKAAIIYAQNPSDAKNRDMALIDNATAKAYENIVSVIESVINKVKSD